MSMAQELVDLGKTITKAVERIAQISASIETGTKGYEVQERNLKTSIENLKADHEALGRKLSDKIQQVDMEIMAKRKSLQEFSEQVQAEKTELLQLRVEVNKSREEALALKARAEADMREADTRIRAAEGKEKRIQEALKS